MPITTILFDLDGTLLSFDQDAFLRAYYDRLAAHVAADGWEPRRFLKSLSAGVDAMLREADGTRTNEARFWDAFLPAMELEQAALPRLQTLLDGFYTHTFFELGRDTPPHPAAIRLVRALRERGYTLAVATAPVFPRQAVLHRLAWAGLNPADFALITSYEDTRFCKPDARYYEECASRLGATPRDCLMVGNDVAEDILPARQADMAVYLVTDWLRGAEHLEAAGEVPGGALADVERMV